MSELDSKSLSELHELAGEAGIEKFRLLRREDLISKLGGGDSDSDSGADGETGSDRDSDSDSDSGRRSGRSRGRRRRSRGGRDSRDDGNGGDDANGGDDSEADADDGDGDAPEGDKTGDSDPEDSGREDRGAREPRGARQSRRSRGGRGRSREGRDGRDARGERDSGGERDGRESGSERTETKSEPELTEISGVLEVLPRGSGLVRGEGAPDAGIYVSPAQIRRCELRSGDEVTGPVRPARRGERRPSLVRVELVNGEPPVDERSPSFEKLTPIAPHRPIPLKTESDDVLARAVDLLTPLAFGQRVLIEAEPRSGRTSFLRALAKAVANGSDDGPEVTVLLIDERPEEVTAWTREASEVEIAAAPADLGAHEQAKVAERTLAKVKRQAEAGKDVVFVVDSLTRLGNAFGDAGSIKPFFGIGRELEEEGTGSITVIATVLQGAPGDQAAMDAVYTTENATLRLDASLAEAGIVPAIDVNSCAMSGQESVLDESGVAAVRRLRAELQALEPIAAAARLAELIKDSASNEELLSRL